MITEKQITLIKNSWCCAINAEKAGKLFYERLFEVAPGLRHHFQGEIKFQARKLFHMVTLIVTKVHELDQILEEVKSLARRHDRYGAEPAHYKVVGECLLWTLEKINPDKWNEETREAWVTVYDLIADTMIKNQAQNLAA
jgi:nitric oxide dioxygenase